MTGPDKNSRIPILIISDGIPGHENQSLGIAEHIPGADIMIHRHHLRIGLSETLFRLKIAANPAISKKSARVYLKQVFDEKIIDEIESHKPAGIIAAGTLAAAPCLLAGALTGAKTCICMTPSLIPISRFDLAVVPFHDNPPNHPKIIKTISAPNRVSRSMLESESRKWSDELPRGDRSVISWVIGGPSSSATFNSELVLDAIEKSTAWADKNNIRIWLSTSRRTPESLENEIEKLKISHGSLEWMLLWHRDNRNPLYAMFHESKTALVTSDSVSMIAEAASAACGPIIFNSSTLSGKHEKMIDRLLDAGYGRLASSSNDLLQILAETTKSSADWPALDETQSVADKFRALT